MGCSDSIKESDLFDENEHNIKTSKKNNLNNNNNEDIPYDSPKGKQNKIPINANKLKVKNRKNSSQNEINKNPRGIISQSEKKVIKKNNNEIHQNDSFNEEYEDSYSNDEDDKSSEGISDMKLHGKNRKSSRRSSKHKQSQKKIDEVEEISKNSSELSSHSEKEGN